LADIVLNRRFSLPIPRSRNWLSLDAGDRTKDQDEFDRFVAHRNMLRRAG
jgi:hypothetical protein